MSNMKKTILGIVILLILVAGGYFFVSQKSEVSLPEAVKDIGKKLGGGSVTSDWRTHTSSKYGFSIKYPSNYIVREESEGIVFIPPELESVTKPPETLKDLPLMVIIPENKSYADASKELKRESEGASYYEETAIKVMGIQGFEVKIGPKSSVGDNLHKLFRVIPYGNKALGFLTMAVTKAQLEQEGAPLLDAFISTFESN